MTKFVHTKGAMALAMALGFCAQSIVPSNSALVSKPITPVEAQHIKGGVIPLAVIVSIVAIDATLTVGMIAMWAVLESTKQQNQNP